MDEAEAAMISRLPKWMQNTTMFYSHERELVSSPIRISMTKDTTTEPYNDLGMVDFSVTSIPRWLKQFLVYFGISIPYRVCKKSFFI